MLKLNEIPPSDRPRERLQSSGPHVLADHELLAILLGSGSAQKDVMRLSAEILPIIDRTFASLSVDELKAISGIGEAKASLLVAALEFARRRIRPHGVKIRSATDILPLVQHLASRTQEHFICITLNGAHEVIATHVVTIGLLNSTQIHPREVFSIAITDRSCSIIVAHNHPSGDPTPSPSDRDVTSVLQSAGKILGIQLLDHIVFSSQRFYSFREGGDM